MFVPAVAEEAILRIQIRGNLRTITRSHGPESVPCADLFISKNETLHPRPPCIGLYATSPGKNTPE